MKNYLLIIVFLFSVLSCKSTKETTSTLKNVDTTVDYDLQSESELSDVSKSAETVSERTLNNKTVKTVVEKIKWSVPDSKGQQYAVETISEATVVVADEIGDKITNRSNQSHVNSITSKTDNTSIKSRDKSKTEEVKVAKVKTPSWIVVVAIILSFGLCVLVYLILRRFRLIE